MRTPLPGGRHYPDKTGGEGNKPTSGRISAYFLGKGAIELGVLFGGSVRGAAGYAPLVVRVLAGIIMFAHGWQKFQGGPASFGQGLAQLGVPLPELMAYVVTFVELVGGVLLIVGLLSRLAALLLTIDLIVAILLVKVNIGLLSPADGSGVGAELDLALI